MNLFGEEEADTILTVDLFAVFYSEYPRHEKIHDARKAWIQKVKSQEMGRSIIEDVKARKQNNWLDKDKQYIPLPASYLRNERWLDEIYNNRNGQHESKSAALVRRQKESGERVRDLLRGTTSDRAENGSAGGSNALVRRRPLGS